MSAIEVIHLEPTKFLPEIIVLSNGTIKITGRLINDKFHDLFLPLFIWVKGLSCQKVKMEIMLEYINTNGALHLIELIRRIESNESIQEIEIVWHFEADDETHYELGAMIEEKLSRSQFKLLSYS
jgi:hypothetical protein